METQRANHETDEQHENVRMDSVAFRDVAPGVEFVCWAVVALAVFLRLVNGAAVTDDQFAIQVVLVTCAATSGMVLRFYNLRSRRF
jgi:hypothetical protein